MIFFLLTNSSLALKLAPAVQMLTLKTTDQYFTDEGSSVSIASLDIRKAFDRVHHFKLYNSLLSAGITIVIFDVLFNWYSKLSFG